MAGWLTESRRFAAFVEANHTKIRKKIRTAADEETLRDVQLELETAYLLLRERALSVVYEGRPGKYGRSPDFTVSYTTSLDFLLEVTRLRAAPASGEELPASRLTDAVCGKLGQLQPGRVNVLLVGVDAAVLPQLDVNAVMGRIRGRAEAGELKQCATRSTSPGGASGRRPARLAASSCVVDPPGRGSSLVSISQATSPQE